MLRTLRCFLRDFLFIHGIFYLWKTDVDSAMGRGMSCVALQLLRTVARGELVFRYSV